MLLTSKFKGWDLPTKVGLLLVHENNLAGYPSCHYQWLLCLPTRVEPKFAGCKSILLATEPKLLNNYTLIFDIWRKEHIITVIVIILSCRWHKRNDAPFSSGVLLYAEKVKSSVFLLDYAQKGIRPIKHCTKTAC